MKKFIAVILSSAMIFGGTSGIFADESIPAALEQTILTVKDKIGIPKEYSEFEYSINTYDNKERYNLNWEKKEYESDDGKNLISVNIDAEGNIYSYENYSVMAGKRGDFSIKNQKSKGECLKAAEDFLKKVLPENYSEFELCDNSINGNFVFRQVKNGIPVRHNVINITMDLKTLDIINYDFNKADCVNHDFESKENIISKEAASKIFFDNAKFEPAYYFYYDYRTKEKKVFLAYSPDSLYNNSVDAKTGEPFKSESYYLWEMRAKESMADEAGGAVKKADLSEEELSEVDKSKDILSKEAADSEIRKLIPEGAELKEMESAGLSRDRIDTDKYIWNINYKNGHASFDAKTKKLRSFYIYNGNQPEADIENGGETKKEVSEERKAKALEFINKVDPEKADLIELEPSDGSRDGYLSFVRKVNGFKFYENNITVTFDKDDNIIGYDCYWYDSVKFPEAKNIVDSKEIFDKVKETADFDLIYENFEKNKKSNIILAYSFIKTTETAPYIDAKTGEELDYEGKKYSREFKIPESYPDIKGHWCEKYVNTLLNSNIYVKREMFLPDEKITKKELLDYYMGFDEKTRKDFKDSDDFITREEICEVISKTLGYGKLADTDAFKNPFNDVLDTDDGFGYMAIANALDIVTMGEDGGFYPDREITNAEAAKIIFGIEAFREK
ncbi:MAG: hypothetical protein HFE59_06400 [Clostridiales bacterium]|nr:hypothetical protein [Clostridiales bacterium]